MPLVRVSARGRHKACLLHTAPWAASSSQLWPRVGCDTLRDPHLGQECFLKAAPELAQAPGSERLLILTHHSRSCLLRVSFPGAFCFQTAETGSHLQSGTRGHLEIFVGWLAGCIHGYMEGRKDRWKFVKL